MLNLFTGSWIVFQFSTAHSTELGLAVGANTEVDVLVKVGVIDVLLAGIVLVALGG